MCDSRCPSISPLQETIFKIAGLGPFYSFAFSNLAGKAYKRFKTFAFPFCSVDFLSEGKFSC